MDMGHHGTQTPDSTFLLARVQYKVSNPLSLLSAVGSSNQPAGSPDVSLSPSRQRVVVAEAATTRVGNWRNAQSKDVRSARWLLCVWVWV